MLRQRRRRWANNKATLVDCLVFAGRATRSSKHEALSQCCFSFFSFEDDGPIIKQHWDNDSCLLGLGKPTLQGKPEGSNYLLFTVASTQLLPFGFCRAAPPPPPQQTHLVTIWCLLGWDKPPNNQPCKQSNHMLSM